MMKITRREFLKHPKKYLDYSGGDRQVTILTRDGQPWMILGRGPQAKVTPAKIKVYDDLFDSTEHLPEPEGSWFD